jgi:Tfp pilus assembly protein PilO
MKLNLEILSKLRKYEIIVASGLVIVVVIILIFTALLPNFNRAQKIYREQQNLTLKLDNLRKKDRTLSSIDYQYYKENFPKIGYVLPESKDYVSLFTTFDNLEKDGGVSVVKTDFQMGIVSTDSARTQKNTSSGAYFIPVSIDLIGNITSLSKFIKALSDYSGRFLTVENFSFVNKDFDTLLLTLNTRAYFYILPTTIGSIDSPITKISQNQEKILEKIGKIERATQEDTLNEKEIGKKDLFQ